MATGDSWASQIARPMWLNKDRDASAWIPLFFSSYVFVVGLVLMNVVVAVLLDAFVTSVERERVLLLNQHEMLANTTKAKMSEGPLDALTSTLSFFSSPLDLEQKLGKLFHRMDLDENHALSFKDFSQDGNHGEWGREGGGRRRRQRGQGQGQPHDRGFCAVVAHQGLSLSLSLSLSLALSLSLSLCE